MMELIVALTLLLILSTCFCASLKVLREMDGLFTRENRAVLVLDNTVERLSHEKNISSEIVKSIFLDEYDKSALREKSSLKPVFESDNNGLNLQILKKNGKPLAEISIKMEQK